MVAWPILKQVAILINDTNNNFPLSFLCYTEIRYKTITFTVISIHTVCIT